MFFLFLSLTSSRLYNPGNQAKQTSQSSTQQTSPSSTQQTSPSSTQQTSPSSAQKVMGGLEHVNMIRQAFNETVKNVLPPNVVQKVDQPDMCNPGGVEGNWNVLNDELKKECLEVKKQKVEAVEKLKKKVIQPSPKDQCVEKLNKGTLACQIRNIMGNDLNKEHFEVVSRGNVIELLNDGRPVMLAIREKLHYEIKEAQTKKKPAFSESPVLRVQFNKYGGVVKQTGSLPKPKDDDPCSQCLRSLDQKDEATEGRKDSCGGCNDINDLSNIGEGAFIVEGDSRKRISNDSEK